MTRPTPSVIVFDKDGTLFDLQATWGAFAGKFLRECAGGDDAVFEALADAAGYDSASGNLFPESVIVAETPERIADTLRPFLADPPARNVFIERLNRAAAIAPLAAAVPLLPLLSGLRDRNLKLAVATNDAEIPARAHLGAEGVEGFFDLVIGYDSGYGGKPAPGQLLAIAEILDVPPQQLVMVGDSLHDLMAGRAAGAATVGVLTGAATAHDLAAFADVVMSDIGDLPTWLESGCP